MNLHTNLDLTHKPEKLREKEAEIAENPNKHNFVQYLSSEA